MSNGRLSIGLRAILAVFAVLLLVTSTRAVAQQETVLYSFTGTTDGSTPHAGLIFDAVGNLYGTTSQGGAYGFGTAFELTPTAGGSWTETVLHNFNNNGIDGSYPLCCLIFDSSGNLYGTTWQGGAYGYGTVFELTPSAGGSWTETLLHSFKDADGSTPGAGLIFDSVGNLYGTTLGGGGYRSGTVFELTPTVGGGWTEKVLYNFKQKGKRDGARPNALIFDASGNLYGTTAVGGAYNFGTAFELTPRTGGNWTERLLHSFQHSPKDGDDPEAGLIFDASGNLYRTTGAGGKYSSSVGTVFELSPIAGGGWTEKVLHNFLNHGNDGTEIEAGLTFDAAGNLYGTANSGGAYGFGTAFELTPTAGGSWTETVLHSFGDNGTDGTNPGDGDLIFDAVGNLYGTTVYGGAYGWGTVFEIAR